MEKVIIKYQKLPKELKATMWYTICNVLQKCISFITLPLFTNLLSTEQYGILSVYQSWMNIMLIFFTLNLHVGGVFNNAMMKYEHDRERFISSIQTLTTLLTCIMFIIYIIATDFWNEMLKLPTILMLLMFVEILFCTSLGLWSGKQKFQYKYKMLVGVTLFISIMNPVIGVIFVSCAEEKGIARIISIALINVLVGVVLYLYNLYKGKTLYVKEYWVYALKFNLPLVPYYLSCMIFNQSDRIMINNIVGVQEAGIYSVVYNCSTMITFVINAVNNSFIPWVYQKLKAKEYDILGKISSFLLIMVAAIVLIVMMVAPEIIKIVAAPAYYDAIWIMPPVIASVFFLFLTQIYINIEFYYEKNGYLVMASIGSAFINIILNWVAIKRYGYISAGYTTLISYILFALSNYYFMKKICKKDEHLKNPIFNVKIHIMISIVVISLMISITFLYKSTIIRWILLLITGIAILRNHKKIQAYINIINKKSAKEIKNEH